MSQLRAGSMENPHKQLAKALDILERLARHGLIHCDLNEFNLMVHHDGAVTVIDFPQMISTNHPNAEQYFDRDVQGICKFFYMKMKIAVPAAECPTFKKVLQLQAADAAAAESASPGVAGEATGGSGEVVAAASTPDAASASAEGSGNNKADDDKAVVAAPFGGEESAAAGGDAAPTVSGEEIGGKAGGALQDRAVRAADVRSAKEHKRAELVGKRLRLDEQVKASGFITAAQDAALAKFYEEQAASEAEARARGDSPENDEDDDDADSEDDSEEESDGDGVAEGSDEDGEEDEDEEEEGGDDQPEEDGEEAAVGGGGARCNSLGNGTRAASTGKIVPPPARGRGYVAALNEAAALAAKKGGSASEAPVEGVGAVVRSGSNLIDREVRPDLAPESGALNTRPWRGGGGYDLSGDGDGGGEGDRLSSDDDDEGQPDGSVRRGWTKGGSGGGPASGRAGGGSQYGGGGGSGYGGSQAGSVTSSSMGSSSGYQGSHYRRGKASGSTHKYDVNNREGKKNNSKVHNGRGKKVHKMKVVY